jgi:hypothetical protein
MTTAQKSPRSVASPGNVLSIALYPDDAHDSIMAQQRRKAISDQAL